MDLGLTALGKTISTNLIVVGRAKHFVKYITFIFKIIMVTSHGKRFMILEILAVLVILCWQEGVFQKLRILVVQV